MLNSLSQKFHTWTSGWRVIILVRAAVNGFKKQA